MLIQGTAVRMAKLIGAALEESGVKQSEFCRCVGVSQKHLSQVLIGRATAHPATLDYWAFMLGLRFEVTLVAREGQEC